MAYPCSQACHGLCVCLSWLTTKLLVYAPGTWRRGRRAPRAGPRGTWARRPPAAPPTRPPAQARRTAAARIGCRGQGLRGLGNWHALCSGRASPGHDHRIVSALLAYLTVLVRPHRGSQREMSESFLGNCGGAGRASLRQSLTRSQPQADRVKGT